MKEPEAKIRFDLIRPDVPPIADWVQFLDRTYDAGQFSNGGPLVRELADRVAVSYGGFEYSVVHVCNATVGLTAALQSRTRPGRGVILPSFTFPATLHAVLMAGGVPVVADVSPATWSLSEREIAAAIQAAAEAGITIDGVVPVRPFGSLVDLGGALAECATFGLWSIVDAAAALPAPSAHFRFGSASREIEVVSLHATKAAGIGEGGLIFVPDEHLDSVSECTNFGLRADGRFVDGTNAKMDEFAAARALSLFGRLESSMQRRERLAQAYLTVLEMFPEVESLPNATRKQPWSVFPILMPTKELRDQFEVAMAAALVSTRRYYCPTLSRGYRGNAPVLRLNTPVSDALSDRILCLPMRSDLSDDQQAVLMTRVRAALARVSGR